MKKGWRVIFGIVMVAVLFGVLCCGVGVLTGADFDRIVLNLDEHYHVMNYLNTWTAYAKQMLGYITNLF